MHEIDLIPEFYRIRVWKLHILKIFAVMFCVLFVTSGAAYGALEYVKRDTNYEISKLFEIKEEAGRQLDTLKILRNEKKELDYQWALLSGLRSAIAAEDLFPAIDKAIQDLDIWFTSIRFQRAEVEVPENNEVNRGYFVIISPGEEKESWAIGTKMLIIGEVLNHSTLSSFVKNLLDQPEVLDANVLETSTNNINDIQSVRFNLSIDINLDKKLS